MLPIFFFSFSIKIERPTFAIKWCSYARVKIKIITIEQIVLAAADFFSLSFCFLFLAMKNENHLE
jgi:hypothetical protein